MSDKLTSRTILEKRIEIGGETAKVSRDGNHIKIEYPWAGRVTRETERFYADDIRALAQFVEETDAETSA